MLQRLFVWFLYCKNAYWVKRGESIERFKVRRERHSVFDGHATAILKEYFIIYLKWICKAAILLNGNRYSIWRQSVQRVLWRNYGNLWIQVFDYETLFWKESWEWRESGDRGECYVQLTISISSMNEDSTWIVDKFLFVVKGSNWNRSDFHHDLVWWIPRVFQSWLLLILYPSYVEIGLSILLEWSKMAGICPQCDTVSILHLDSMLLAWMWIILDSLICFSLKLRFPSYHFIGSLFYQSDSPDYVG